MWERNRGGTKTGKTGPLTRWEQDKCGEVPHKCESVGPHGVPDGPLDDAAHHVLDDDFFDQFRSDNGRDVGHQGAHQGLLVNLALAGIGV